MQTLEKLKDVIEFRQTDEFFIEHLNNLESKGVLEIKDGDVIDGKVKDSFFKAVVTGIYGIALDSDFNPIELKPFEPDEE